MLTIKFASLLLLLCVFNTNVYGFYSYCGSNQTLFVQEGSKATFSAATDISYVYWGYLRKHSNKRTHYIYQSDFQYVDLTKDLTDITDDMYFSDPLMKNRTEIKAGNMSHTTIIHNVEITDNGTYVLYLDRAGYICFALFVMGIYRQPEGLVEEHSPAYLYGYPKASEIRRPLANATMMWLVDGKNVSQDPQFVIQDGLIWIGSISRTLNGKNITYRALKDIGLHSETNYTVQVTYGPEAPLHFSRNKIHYFLKSGETMPDISCTVDCNPACAVSWDRLGLGHILRLEKVSSETTGEYVCTATRPGVDIVVNRSLIVHVTDNSAFTIAIALLASIQAVTTIILGLCGVFVYMRRGQSHWSSCLKTSSSQPADASTTKSGIENNSCETEMEHYEVLDSESRNVTTAKHYEDVQPKGSSSEQHLELYVNTNIGSNRL